MIGRLFSSLAIGLFLSLCGGGLIALVGTLTNLPRILIGLGMLFRTVLRYSFHLYAWLLARPSTWFMNRYGLDMFAPHPRTAACILLSTALGWGLLALLDWTLTIWWLVIFVAHGLLVGLTWEQIVVPGDFQMGERQQ